MWIATYTDPRSLSGKGMSIVATEDMPRIVATHADVEFRLYSPEHDPIFTADTVAACMGTSPSV